MQVGANVAGRERRRHLRVRLEVTGRLEAPPHAPVPCEIYNLSLGGALIESQTRLRLAQSVVLHVDGFGPIEAHVARVTSTTVGLAFERIDQAALDAFIMARTHASGAESRLEGVAKA